MKKIGVLLVLLILISPISFALEPGKLYINNVLIPLEAKVIEKSKEPEEAKSTFYIYANGQRIAKKTNNKLYYFYNDHLGSPRAISDDQGNIVWKADYLPFGEVFNEQGNSNVKYNSKELDLDTKLHYYGARYYLDELGRFITADTVEMHPNAYVYVKNNPLKFVDLRGEQKKKALALRASLESDPKGALLDFDIGVQNIRNAGYEVIADTVSTEKEFIDAILNFPGKIDFFYETAHGTPTHINLGEEWLTNQYLKNLGPEFAEKFSKDAKIILSSCSVCSKPVASESEKEEAKYTFFEFSTGNRYSISYEYDFATAFSEAAGNIETQGLHIPAASYLDKDLNLMRYIKNENFGKFHWKFWKRESWKRKPRYISVPATTINLNKGEQEALINLKINN